ncbi:MAG: Glu-tRNA(Gln) amidotransferase subunit GatE [Promethearchaeota archaeon]
MYEEVGLKVGIEIHQQLQTRQKLFCRCPAELGGTADPDFTFTRRFRPVLGEMGVFDEAMVFEFKKGMTVHYEGYHDLTCTYELDETPPFPCNEEALDVAIEIAQLLKMSVFNELHVCRKNYLDGSVTCGFQRTMIVAKDGWYPLASGKKIGVELLCLEEDACRKVKTEGRDVYFRLDRLGIPLVEIATKPDITDPHEAREAALRLGLILRGTGKVRTIIGSIRQDINISVREGTRVEIKGVQKLDWIPPLIENEVSRQLELVKIKRQLEELGVSPDDVDQEPRDLSDAFANTKCRFIAAGLKKGQRIHGVKVPKFEGLLGHELQPGRRLGTEVSDRVKAVAGLAGILHSDEDLGKYQISEEEVDQVRRALDVGDGDAFVLVLGPPGKLVAAFKAIIERVKETFEGVPPETRRAREDMNSEFLRKLHGGARLYPDTDSRAILVTDERVEAIASRLGPYPWEMTKSVAAEYDLPEDEVERLMLAGRLPLFLKLVELDDSLSRLAASTLLETCTALRRDGVEIDRVGDEAFVRLFQVVKSGKIAKEAMETVLTGLAADPSRTVDEIVEESDLTGFTEQDLRALVEKVVSDNLEMVKERGLRAMGPLMGDVMKEARGKIDGKVVSAKLREVIELVLAGGGGARKTAKKKGSTKARAKKKGKPARGAPSRTKRVPERGGGRN